MLAVADSTILIRLGRVKRLGLLKALYGQVIIPPRVWQEVTVDGAGFSDAAELIAAHQAGWVTITAPTNSILVDALLGQHRGLDRGEAEAIVVATEIAAHLILIDEETGYKTASVADHIICPPGRLHDRLV